MSSAEDDFNDEGNFVSGSGSKKRRVQRACDVCRRKKIRCDGGQMLGNKCSNCTSCGSECTYVEAAKKRGPSKGYVANLENRLQKMEKLFLKLAPSGDFVREQLDGRSDWSQTTDAKSQTELPTSSYPPLYIIKTSNTEDEGLVPPVRDGGDDGDGDKEFKLSEYLDQLRLDPAHQRFFGQSSGITLIQAAISLKSEYTGKAATTILPSKRPEFWTVRPWEVIQVEMPTYVFPDDKLMIELIDLYFNYDNIFIPILHRPTLDKGIADGLHLKDAGFGEVVLLVCAIGSRRSNDPRVFLPDVGSELSAGWKWFDQTRTTRKPVLTAPCLYDLQIQFLSVLFLHDSSAPQRCWSMTAVGIRLAQEVGAHRRKIYASAMTVEEELWKRVFWALVYFDRFLASFLGRPCATQDEDFDIDFPVDCDDEYWEHPDPEKAFKQPPNKPSKVSFFISILKLSQILAFALRTVYATNKAKAMLGFMGNQWNQKIVVELDSALNKWTDGVPDHLRWEPNQGDVIFFDQSAFLHVWFHNLQILVHRPFISSPYQPSHIIDIQHRRTGTTISHIHMPLFAACIVLLVNIWGRKRSRLSTIANKDMEDVQKCLTILKIAERRWQPAGRLRDIVQELANAGQFTLLQPNQEPSYKRERDCDSPKPTSSVIASSSSAEGTRDITRPQSVSIDRFRAPNSATEFQLNSLPTHSDEPKRLPARGEVELLSHNNEPIDTTNQSWFSAFGDTPAISGQPLAVNPSQSYSGLDPSSVTAPLPDHLFCGQARNEFSSSFDQPLNRGHGLSYGLYPTNVDPNQQFLDQYPQSAIDDDTIAMWSLAPTGFELDDWDSYMNQLNLAQPHSAYHEGL